MKPSTLLCIFVASSGAFILSFFVSTNLRNPVPEPTPIPAPTFYCKGKLTNEKQPHYALGLVIDNLGNTIKIFKGKDGQVLESYETQEEAFKQAQDCADSGRYPVIVIPIFYPQK